MGKLLGAGAGHPHLSSRQELVEQWHPTKNGAKTPDSVSLGSRFRAWWLCMTCSCEQAHEWQARVDSRALNNAGCPVCAGKRPCRCSSLAALRPGLAAEWHPAGNEELTPEGATLHSGRKVQWVCHKHGAPFTWAASIHSRTKPHKPAGCPECARHPRGPSQGKHSSSSICAGVVLSW